MVIQLEDSSFKKVFLKQYPEVASIDENQLNSIRILISDYIRRECETIKADTVEYLWPLTGFIQSNYKTRIFTVNYDGTLEVFCETNNIRFSDGFNPYWNPQSFTDSNVNIFKLHGSLYWFRTESGKIIRVPVKGLNISKLKYITDESVSEMMIYPVLQKDKQSEVYLSLHNRFINELNRADTCIIIGYSFRDEDIRKVVLDSLKRNPNLWLIIVSPNAFGHKSEYFGKDLEITSRIFTIDKSIEEILSTRKLDKYLSSLYQIRDQEQDLWKAQSTAFKAHDQHVTILMNAYRKVGLVDPIPHQDRITWIQNKISKRIRPF
jgi:hypothetical protein